MKNALENTYGIIVYQEQVMQISKDLCGFTGGQADTLRKGIGKKIPEVLAKMKVDFIDGAVKHGKADRKQMEVFWSQIEEFAAYAFNKVHSACYGLIAYQTAYLKAHYPIAFMAALMTSDFDNTDRLAIEIAECKKMGIEVLPPNVSGSFHEFAVVPGKKQIRFGLDAVKNVGHGAAEAIINGREKAGGSFKTLEDYCRHVDVRIVNHKSLESLIKAGAFDEYGDRSVLLNSIDSILALANRLQKDANSGQIGLFGGGDDNKVMSPQLVLDSGGLQHTPAEQLNWERELLGLYLSRHPLEPYIALLADQSKSVAEILAAPEGSTVVAGGIISEIREITTKNGAKMAFIKVADMFNTIEMVLFPKIYERLALSWQVDQVVIAKGKIGSGRGAQGSGESKLLADEVRFITLEEASNYKPGSQKAKHLFENGSPGTQRLYIRLENGQDHPTLMSLKQKLDGHKGATEVVLVTGPSEKKQIIKLPQTIEINESSLRDLAAIFGPTNVVVK